MEGSVCDAATAMTAPVVREFTPSRIERQLLAQVFELVLVRPDVEEPGYSSEAAARTGRVVCNDQQAIEGKKAGRRAA